MNPRAKLWYSLVVVLLLCIALTVVNVVISKRAAAEQGRKMCDLMVALDTAYQENPPQTPTGITIAGKVHHLRESLGCDG